MARRREALHLDDLVTSAIDGGTCVFRVVCGLVALWSALAAPLDVAAGQGTAPTLYLQLVERYLEGDHVRAVVDLLGLPASDAARDGRAELERADAQYARPKGRAAARKEPAVPTVAQLDERLRAIAALHLEAAVAAPRQSETTRRAHLRLSELALDTLEKAQDRRAATPAGEQVDTVDDALMDVFLHSWFVAGLTHLQRVGAVADALRLADDALETFPDDADFWVIRGGLNEALATFGVTLDADRARVFPAVGADGAPAAALAAARAAFERARRLDPDHGDARIHLARVVALQGEVRLAQQLLATDGESPRLAYLTALLNGGFAQELKQFDRAVEHFRRAGGVLPQSRAACIGLAHALAMGGRASEARANLRPCLSSGGPADDPWLRYSMGLEWLFEPAIHDLRAHVRGARPTAP